MEKTIKEYSKEAKMTEQAQLADDCRYPYTYAADYLRMKIGDDYGKGLISRAAASHAKALIAKAIGMDERELACKLADAYLSENNKEVRSDD